MSLDNRKTTLKSYNDAVVDNDVRHITVNVDSIDIAVIKRLIHEHVSVWNSIIFLHIDLENRSYFTRKVRQI